MKTKRQVVLFSSMSPEHCLRAMQNAIDQEPSNTSPSGYSGSKAVVGEIEGYTFRIHKRQFWRNHFAIHFYGELVPTNKGTQVKGHFDISEFGRILQRMVLAAMAIMGLPFFFIGVKELSMGGNYLQGNHWVVVVAIPILLMLGLSAGKIGPWTDIAGKMFLLDFLRSTLAAKTHPNLPHMAPTVSS